MKRHVVAWLLWACAAAAAAATSIGWDDPCGSNDVAALAVLATGVLTAAALFASLQLRPAVGVVVSVIGGAAAGRALWFFQIFHWVANCTA